MIDTIKLFLDTEFTGLHKNTTLISLALVTEFNETFYAEFTDYDKEQVDEWLKDNVLKNLMLNSKDYVIVDNKREVKTDLVEWLENLLTKYNTIKFEVWSDCLAYDWVLFNDLFGTALNIPNYIYYIPFDICTVFKLKNIDPDINREEFSNYQYTESDKKHNALTDARVIKACYEKLLQFS